MIPKYIKLETLRQQQEKEIGGDISLFDLAVNLKEMNTQLFVHREYLAKNTILPFMAEAAMFLAPFGLAKYTEKMTRLFNVSNPLSKITDDTAFFELDSYEIGLDGINNVRTILWDYTNKVILGVFFNVEPFPQIVNWVAAGLAGDTELREDIAKQEGLLYFPKPKWLFVEPSNEEERTFVIDETDYRIATISYSALYVMNKDVNSKNKQTPTLSSLETISNKKQPAETYLEKQIAEKLPELEHDKANYKRLVEVLKRYEVGDLSLTIDNAEIQETRKEVYTELNRFGLSTDKKRTLDNFCKVKMLHFRKGKRPK